MRKINLQKETYKLLVCDLPTTAISFSDRHRCRIILRMAEIPAAAVLSAKLIVDQRAVGAEEAGFARALAQRAVNRTIAATRALIERPIKQSGSMW